MFVRSKDAEKVETLLAMFMHNSFTAHLFHTLASGHKFHFHVKAPHIGPCQRKATHCRHGILTESVCLSDFQVDKDLHIWTTHPMAAMMLRLQWNVNILEISISMILAHCPFCPQPVKLFSTSPTARVGAYERFPLPLAPDLLLGSVPRCSFGLPLSSSFTGLACLPPGPLTSHGLPSFLPPFLLKDQ